MKRYATLVVLLVTATGCRDARPPQDAGAVLTRVRQITAKHLGIHVDEVKPTSTFRSLGADALDIVEITMETEDQLGIAIRDEDLDAVAGTANLDTLPDRLTVKAFAEVAARSEKAKPVPAGEPRDPKVLNKHDVGSYSELSKKPNPHGFVLVPFLPPPVLLKMAEHDAGRELTAEEAEVVKQNAVVTAFPPDQAEAIMRKRRERLKTEQSLPVERAQPPASRPS